MNAPAAKEMHTGNTSFATVSLDEAIARACSLIPVLRERATRAEGARQLLPETEADMHRLGLLRFVQPKNWGGMELDFVAHFDITSALARGCASTAWTVGNLAIHHWLLAMFDERAQAEVWSVNPDAKIASGIAYPQGRARKVDGGYSIDGDWNFSSGVDGAQWNQLAVMVREGDKVVDYRMCLVPESDYTIIDDWQVLGMRGTGSKSVRAREVFVPEHRALGMLKVRGGNEFPGAKVNPNLLYQIPLSGLGTHCIAGVAVGNAEAAIEMTVEAVKARSTSYVGAQMRDFQAVQLRIAEAATKVKMARLLCRDNCLEGQAILASGRLQTNEEKLAFRRDVAYAARMCTEAIDSLHTMAGANGIYDSYPIQRMFRDSHSLNAHIGLSWDVQGWPWALVAMGGEYKNPTL